MLAMENSHHVPYGNGTTENGHLTVRDSSYPHSTRVPPLSLSWLDLKVFYVRVTNSELDDSTPEYLTLNHIPLYRDTLLEVNGVRTSIHSDGVSSLLRRDRLDKKSEEVTFVCTDSIRVSGSVQFEVFDKDMPLLCGSLELCASNGCVRETENVAQRWNMHCDSDIVSGTGFLKGKQYTGMESVLPKIEVFVAGCFSGTPIILTKTIQLGFRKKQKGMLVSIPEYETSEGRNDDSSGLALQTSNYKPEYGDYNDRYISTDYYEGGDEELSWFNAGVRVGVGIGLSMCVGIGIGVGLLVRTYQGATQSVFRRRLL